MRTKVQIECTSDSSPGELIERFQSNRKPVIIKNANIGPCSSLWKPEYLAEKIGQKPVKVHVSAEKQMNFIKKNFAYKTMPFDRLVQRASESKHDEFFIDENEVYYLRALGDDPRGRDVSDFRTHFKELAEDLTFPEYFSQEQYFSSVLRVASAGCQLWTHYDIMDNILIQVIGRKRAVLFDPADTLNLYLDGDKSEIIDIDNPDYEKYPLFRNVVFYEGFLDPGDIIFIPALWMHNMISLDFGVAVNVFWKNLDNSLYNQKDPYGNKDLLPAEKALQSVENALKLLKNLPKEYSDFYHKRILTRVEKSMKEL